MPEGKYSCGCPSTDGNQTFSCKNHSYEEAAKKIEKAEEEYEEKARKNCLWMEDISRGPTKDIPRGMSPSVDRAQRTGLSPLIFSFLSRFLSSVYLLFAVCFLVDSCPSKD